MTPATFISISLANANHMAMPNLKEWLGIAVLSMCLESEEPEVTAGQH